MASKLIAHLAAWYIPTGRTDLDGMEGLTVDCGYLLEAQRMHTELEARARGKAHARRGPQARGGRKAGDVALAGDEDAARAEEADAAHDLRRHTERIARHAEILCLIQARHHNGRRADAHKKMRAQSGGVLALAAGHADDAAAEERDGKAHQHGDKIHFVQMLYNSAERCFG